MGEFARIQSTRLEDFQIAPFPAIITIVPPPLAIPYKSAFSNFRAQALPMIDGAWRIKIQGSGLGSKRCLETQKREKEKKFKIRIHSRCDWIGPNIA